MAIKSSYACLDLEGCATNTELLSFALVVGHGNGG